jgi:hypothetical protein
MDRFDWGVAVSGCARTSGVPVVELFSSVFYYNREGIDEVVIITWSQMSSKGEMSPQSS